MVDLVISFIFLIDLTFAFVKQYGVVQACHYEIKKYLKYNGCKKVFVSILNAMLFSFSFFVNDIDRIVITVLVVIISSFSFYNKNKIKYTNRIKRLLTIYSFVTGCALMLFYKELLVVRVMSSFFILHLVIVHFISAFLEKTIMFFYTRSAKKIIKNVNVIGVTGSYGKTSCKNIIYDMLKDRLNISKTPKSYNTKVGIVKSIRENVGDEDDYFICEYGVDRKGGMNKLLRVIKPCISLITEIGPQHLLTFKNIENIKNEKIKIAKILKENQYAVINNDNEYLRKEICDLKCNVVTYGIKNQSMIMAKNINISNRGSSFDLYINDKKSKKIKIELLGEHNVLNVLGAIGVLFAMKIDLEDVQNMTGLIKPIEHRLQLKQIQGVKIIDDSFNSNEVGFKKAIDILNLMDKERFVITPGIIEQGENSYRVNYELGRYMSCKIDFAILVEDNAFVLKQGLMDGGFSEEKIVIKNSFKEAWEYIKSINDDNKIFLIENDLPNIYLK